MRRVLFMFLLLLSVSVYAQESPAPAVKSEESKTSVKFPVQAKSTDIFNLGEISFNKKIDPKGKGELLQVEFVLRNNTNMERNLYIFIMATYENIVWAKDSFGRDTNIPVTSGIEFFKAVPFDLSLYEYEKNGKKELYKFPKNIKAGTDPESGKPYLLKEKQWIHTELLSEYRSYYRYFNHATILIFDDQEQLLYRRIFEIKKK